MLKVTIVYPLGIESSPQDCAINDADYILLPEDARAVAYRIFAPLESEKDTGPWLYVRTVKRNEARRARRTVVGRYLEPRTPDPLNDPLKISFPAMVDSQDFWYLYGGGQHGEPTPIGLFGRMGNHHRLPEKIS